MSEMRIRLRVICLGSNNGINNQLYSRYLCKTLYIYIIGFMAKQEGDHLLQPGIERVLLFSPQKDARRLAKAVIEGVDAIDRINAELPPEEQEKHVTIIFVFPEPVNGDELLSLILADPPQDEQSPATP